MIIHESIYNEVAGKLKDAYGQLRIGNPLDQNNHVGPLIDKMAVDAYLNSIEQAKQQGASVLVESGVS